MVSLQNENKQTLAVWEHIHLSGTSLEEKKKYSICNEKVDK